MAASNEARRERYLMGWQFSIQYLDWLQQNALPLLQQENPAAIPRLISQAVSFAHQVARRIIQHSDLPGLPEELPEIPEPMPADQQINQLMQQMQQMQMQLEQAMGENQQLKMQFAGTNQPTEGLPS
jgi:septation ring formation regulator EzrA